MPTRKSKIRVLLADDHAILRSGLRLLVNSQSDMEVISEASDGEQAVRAARETRPDVALLDLTMPGGGGMRALQEIARDCPKTRTLVLTMHDDPAYLRSVLAAGASGYVLKRSVDAELLPPYEQCIGEGPSWTRVWPARLSRTYLRKKAHKLAAHGR